MDAIDVHAHLYPRSYLDAVSTVGRDHSVVGGSVSATLDCPFIRDLAVARDDGLEARLALMDAAGLRQQVLSLGAPNVWHPDPPVRARLCRTYNDACLEVCHSHPDRFFLFASLPLPFVAECFAEMERVLHNPAVVGVALPTHIAGKPIDDAAYRPLYEALDVAGTVVFFHPDGWSCGGQLQAYAMDWTLGALVDDTVVAVRLGYSGLLRDYPRIRWIIPHLGGMLPAVWGRLDEFWHHEAPELQQVSAVPPTTWLAELYYDTVSSQPELVELAARLVGADRLLLGSDFPYRAADDLGAPLETLAATGLAQPALEDIRRGNAAMLLSSTTRGGSKT